ncbi:MAG: dipeptide ABC transporter ATP-binding protein [bacterium]
MGDAQRLLDVRDLRVEYATRRGTVHAVRNASFAVRQGEIFGLVGESGSGKSSAALAVMGALKGQARVSGAVRYRGEDLLQKSDRELRDLWGRRLAMVFQNPGSTLNPVLRVGEQLVEVLRAHTELSRTAAWDRALELFRAVQLPEAAALARRYPHQLSGGQQQRVSIAIALACDPDLLIMDEPTTGLDVTTEARILDLVRALRRRTRAAILYISHNLGVIAQLCDAVAVMYAGEVVERGAIQTIFERPRHPYTVALLNCLPRADAPPAERILPAIEGALPDPAGPVTRCQFAERCPMAEDRCRREHPALFEAAAGHVSRCFFWDRVPPPLVRVMPPAGAVTHQRAGSPDAPPLLEGVDLAYEYRRGAPWLPRVTRSQGPRALDGVSLHVASAETLAIVGESGSGKTTLARCLVGLLQPDRGEVRLNGRALPSRPSTWPRGLRRRLQMVFQNPDLTLNPQRTVFDAVARPLVLFGLARGDDVRARAAELLRAVRLEERYLHRFPQQLSGGERQRVAIARAFAASPDLVVCDEPTSALDVSVQAVVLNLLVDLQRRRQSSYVFITHDLSVVRHLADRVLVLYLGKIVESGPTEAVFNRPHHPYTEVLLSAVPVIGARPPRDGVESRDVSAQPLTGCPFHLRCPRKIGAVCETQEPPLVTDEHGHSIACHIPPADLAKLQSPGPIRDA